MSKLFVRSYKSPNYLFISPIFGINYLVGPNKIYFNEPNKLGLNYLFRPNKIDLIDPNKFRLNYLFETCFNKSKTYFGPNKLLSKFFFIKLLFKKKNK